MALSNLAARLSPILSRLWGGGLGVAFLSLPLTAADPPQALVNGGSVQGTISFAGEEHCYSFSANSNEGIQLSVPDVDLTALRPRIEVLDPMGTSLFSVFGSDVAHVTYTTPSTGTYTLLVRDVNSLNTGDYEVHYTRAPGANEWGSLVDGTSFAETIGLGDLDSFTFSAAAGQTAAVTVTDSTGASLRPHVTLYGPTGMPIGMPANGNDVATLVAPISTSGTYTLVVRDTGGVAGTGPYSIIVNGAGAAPVPLPWIFSALLAALVSATGLILQRSRCGLGSKSAA